MMNEYISRIKGSASMELMAKANDMKKQGVDVIGLGGGEPDFDTPQVIKNVAIAELLNGNTHYAVGKGILKLRERISKKLYDDNGIKMSPDEIVVTPGGKIAIYLAVRSLINAGDEVLILNPGWVSYDEIVVASGGTPINVPLNSKNNYYLDYNLLEKYVSNKTKVIIVNSPNNPTGHVLGRDELLVLKKFVLNHNLILISDEIYEKIVFDGHKVCSPAADPELRNQTITINGFSKAYAMTGWRLGYLAADIEIINTITKLYTHTITGTSPFIQEAAVVALDCDNEVEIMRKKYEERRNRFIKALNEIPYVEAKLPEGVFYAWVKFSYKDMNAYQVADLLLTKAHVIGVPGPAYGLSGDNYIRFSFANSDEDLDEAVRRIKSVFLDSTPAK